MSPATYVTRVATYVNGLTYVDDATDVCRKSDISRKPTDISKMATYVGVCRIIGNILTLTYVSAPNISRELPAPNGPRPNHA